MRKITTSSMLFGGRRGRAALVALTFLFGHSDISNAATPGNAGALPADQSMPFDATPVSSFNQPWAIAFLTDGRMVVTERQGRLFLVGQAGRKTEISGVPEVASDDDNGLLDVAVSPKFVEDRYIYLTYSEPGKGLALARARLVERPGAVALADFQVLWRQVGNTREALWGGVLTFDPTGQHLFLAVRDSSLVSGGPSGAQNLDSDAGKILRLNPDGTTPPDNPMAKEGGVRGQIWTWGHRTIYGLAFTPDGRFWEHEMGPRGGDEFNLLKPSENYGWPLVSNGENYDDSAIPLHSTRPDLAAPLLYWSPVIAPAGMALYEGSVFPNWRGSILITALRGQGLVRVTVSADGQVRQINRWDLGARIRDIAVATDGTVWLIEDGAAGRLLRLAPKQGSNQSSRQD